MTHEAQCAGDWSMPTLIAIGSKSLVPETARERSMSTTSPALSSRSRLWTTETHICPGRGSLRLLGLGNPAAALLLSEFYNRTKEVCRCSGAAVGVEIVGKIRPSLKRQKRRRRLGCKSRCADESTKHQFRTRENTQVKSCRKSSVRTALELHPPPFFFVGDGAGGGSTKSYAAWAYRRTASCSETQQQ